MRKAILVPLDGTLVAEQAIPIALGVAGRTGAEIHPVLVHLVDAFRDVGPGPGSIADADQEVELHETDYLDSVAERITDGGVRVHAPVVLHGEVADAVAAHVREHAVSGVVMATHGRGSFERLLVPSVAAGLLRRLPAPMILVRADAERSRQDPARTPEERFEAAAAPATVLVGLDGSADAEAALEHALDVCGPGARCVLLHVVELPPQLSSVYLPHALILRKRDEERLREQAASYLDQVEARVRERAPRTEKRLGVHSRPGHLIARAAEEVGADLIAIGGHGHAALRELLFGSSTHDVLQGSRVPVLVARGVPGGEE